MLSKLLERAVHVQLTEYLTKRGLLYENQSGFRGSHSTDTCLIGLTDYVRAEMGKGNLTGLVLIDLQKAFDTVDHGVLLSKLRSMGVDSVAWFDSYLSNRTQCVENDGVRSDFMHITCGVPQGSILGPLLFLVYINDMHISLNCQLALYADDSALIFSHSNASVIAERLSLELSSCKKWLIDNKLSLHVGKTESMLFGTSRRLKQVREFQVTCDGMAVNRVTSVKYLGVKLDENLSFKAHATEVINKCAGRIAFLYRNSSVLDFNSRRILCNSLIQPYLDYCSSTWYSSLTQCLRNRLDVLQRRMVRFIHSKESRSHIGSSDLKHLAWLSIPDRVQFFKLIQLKKIRLGKAPPYLSHSFFPITQRHTHNTRGSSTDFFVSKDLNRSFSSFAFTAVEHWNGLPSSLKGIDSLHTFKSKLKEYLFELY